MEHGRHPSLRRDGIILRRMDYIRSIIYSIKLFELFGIREYGLTKQEGDEK